MSNRPDFDEALQALYDARSNLTHGRSYHELGDHLFDVAKASIDGTIAVFEAIQFARETE